MWPQTKTLDLDIGNSTSSVSPKAKFPVQLKTHDSPLQTQNSIVALVKFALPLFLITILGCHKLGLLYYGIPRYWEIIHHQSSHYLENYVTIRNKLNSSSIISFHASGVIFHSVINRSGSSGRNIWGNIVIVCVAKCSWTPSCPVINPCSSLRNNRVICTCFPV